MGEILRIPYVVNGPLSRHIDVKTTEVLVDGDIRPGFAQLRDQVCADIIGKPGQVFVIRTNMGEGSTSFLFDVEYQLKGKGAVPVYVDAVTCVAIGKWTKTSLLSFLAGTINYDLTHSINKPHLRSQSAFERIINSRNANGTNVALLIDETPALAELGIPKRRLREVIGCLGNLATQPRLDGAFSMVLESHCGFDPVGVFDLDTLKKEIPTGLNVIRLPLFDVQDIGKLAALVPDLTYSPRALTRIWELGGGNPKLTMEFLSSLVDEGRRTKTGKISERKVDTVVRRVLEKDKYIIRGAQLSFTQQQRILLGQLIKNGKLDLESFQMDISGISQQDKILLDQMVESRTVRTDKKGNFIFAQGAIAWGVNHLPSRAS